MDRITSPRVTFGKFIIVDNPDPAHIFFFLSLSPFDAARGRPPALTPHSVFNSHLCFLLSSSLSLFFPFFSYYFLPHQLPPSPASTLPSYPFPSSPPYSFILFPLFSPYSFIPISRLSTFPSPHAHSLISFPNSRIFKDSTLFLLCLVLPFLLPSLSPHTLLIRPSHLPLTHDLPSHLRSLFPHSSTWVRGVKGKRGGEGPTSLHHI